VVTAQMLRLVSVLAILPSIVWLSMPPPHLAPAEISGAAGFMLELALNADPARPAAAANEPLGDIELP
jgi:hypothetical protein